jgi:amidase
MWRMIVEGRETSGVSLAGATSVLHRITRDYGRFFETYDAYLSPTLAVPPVPLGFFSLDVDPDEHWRAYLGFMPYTHVFNITGQPAMSVPLSWNAQGLPIGVQFAARAGDEATLFRLAGQLEAARPWRGRIPPVSVATAKDERGLYL